MVDELKRASLVQLCKFYGVGRRRKNERLESLRMGYRSQQKRDIDSQQEGAMPFDPLTKTQVPNKFMNRVIMLSVNIMRAINLSVNMRAINLMSLCRVSLW